MAGGTALAPAKAGGWGQLQGPPTGAASHSHCFADACTWPALPPQICGLELSNHPAYNQVRAAARAAQGWPDRTAPGPLLTGYMELLSCISTDGPSRPCDLHSLLRPRCACLPPRC